MVNTIIEVPEWAGCLVTLPDLNPVARIGYAKGESYVVCKSKDYRVVRLQFGRLHIEGPDHLHLVREDALLGGSQSKD